MSATSSFGRFMAKSSERLRSRRLGISADWARQQVEWTGCRADLAGSDPQVSCGSRQTPVPEKQLDTSNICARFKQMDRESMSQRMRCNHLTDARDLACLMASPYYGVCADVLPGDVAGKKPGSRSIHSPPCAQNLQQYR